MPLPYIPASEWISFDEVPISRIMQVSDPHQFNTRCTLIDRKIDVLIRVVTLVLKTATVRYLMGSSSHQTSLLGDVHFHWRCFGKDSGATDCT